MKRQTTRLNQDQQAQASSEHENTQSSAIEFANAEEALRHDSSTTPVPAAVAERLRNSILSEPKPNQSWWQKWLNRSKPGGG